MVEQDFAAKWQDAWNSHDLDRILAHYTQDILFHSRKAENLMGSGEIRGKRDLRTYWSKALERQPNLKFHIKDVFEGHEMLVISYTNHRGTLAAETLYFNTEGLVYRAAACHRAL